jgi:hypothetical protein
MIEPVNARVAGIHCGRSGSWPGSHSPVCCLCCIPRAGRWVLSSPLCDEQIIALVGTLLCSSPGASRIRTSLPRIDFLAAFANKQFLLNDSDLWLIEMLQEVFLNLVFIQTGVFIQHNHFLPHSFNTIPRHNGARGRAVRSSGFPVTELVPGETDISQEIFATGALLSTVG